MTNEEQESFKQDMLDGQNQERQDMQLEYNLRTDYEAFTEYFSEEVEAFQQAVDDFKQLHRDYGHDFCIGDF